MIFQGDASEKTNRCRLCDEMSLFDSLEQDDDAPEAHESAIVPAVQEPLSISAATRLIKGVLEESFASFYLFGEISNLSRPRSGHCYLTLKDEGAQLPAVLWKSVACRLRFDLHDGMEVVCRGRLEVYPPQGKYQLIIEQIEPKGIGPLELAFRRLHEKLAAEGLFDPRRKRPLPPSIRRVAVITSPSGAAVRDFLQVLRRRTGTLDILLVPVKVQGDGAAEEIAAALQTLNAELEQGRKEIDVIVLTRGGGSAEDLWTFNEEVLVRAVAASVIPVVSAVGHEIDISLCDLAADLRALTPSEAAERITPDDRQRQATLVLLRRRLDEMMARRMESGKQRLDFLKSRPFFTRPLRLIEDRIRTVDLLEERLENGMDRRLQRLEERWNKLAAMLETLSPLAVLARGYSLTFDVSGRRIAHVADVSVGSTISTRLSGGILESTVTVVSSHDAGSSSTGNSSAR